MEEKRKILQSTAELLKFSSSCEFPYLMLLLFKELTIYDVTREDCLDR